MAITSKSISDSMNDCSCLILGIRVKSAIVGAGVPAIHAPHLLWETTCPLTLLIASCDVYIAAMFATTNASVFRKCLMTVSVRISSNIYLRTFSSKLSNCPNPCLSGNSSHVDQISTYLTHTHTHTHTHNRHFDTYTYIMYNITTLQHDCITQYTK